MAWYHFNPGEVTIGESVRLSNLAIYPTWQIPSQRENLINRGWGGGHQCLKHYTMTFLWPTHIYTCTHEAINTHGPKHRNTPGFFVYKHRYIWICTNRNMNISSHIPHSRTLHRVQFYERLQLWKTSQSIMHTWMSFFNMLINSLKCNYSSSARTNWGTCSFELFALVHVQSFNFN